MARIAFLCVGGPGSSGHRGAVGGGGGNARRILLGYEFEARGRLGNHVCGPHGRVRAVWDSCEIGIERIGRGYHRHRHHQRLLGTVDEGRHVVCENKRGEKMRGEGIERFGKTGDVRSKKSLPSSGMSRKGSSTK